MNIWKYYLIIKTKQNKKKEKLSHVELQLQFVDLITGLVEMFQLLLVTHRRGFMVKAQYKQSPVELLVS